MCYWYISIIPCIKGYLFVHRIIYQAKKTWRWFGNIDCFPLYVEILVPCFASYYASWTLSRIRSGSLLLSSGRASTSMRAPSRTCPDLLLLSSWLNCPQRAPIFWRKSEVNLGCQNGDPCNQCNLPFGLDHPTLCMRSSIYIMIKTSVYLTDDTWTAVALYHHAGTTTASWDVESFQS